MVGQKKLLSRITEYTIDNFPRSTLFLAEEGMGKHTLVNYIQKEILKLPVMDITESISSEFINKIYLNPNPFIYIIDLSKMTEKQSNIVLKLVEEPINTSFLILLAENSNQILNTILNRCVVYEFGQYTKEELKEFTKGCDNEELIVNVVRSPGKILGSNLDNIKKLYDRCNLIVNQIHKAGYLNTLSLVDEINYKDEYDKFDLNLFFEVLKYTCFEAYRTLNKNKFLTMYTYIAEEHKKINLDKRLNGELFMINFFSNLREKARFSAD